MTLGDLKELIRHLDSMDVGDNTKLFYPDSDESGLYPVELEFENLCVCNEDYKNAPYNLVHGEKYILLCEI